MNECGTPVSTKRDADKSSIVKSLFKSILDLYRKIVKSSCIVSGILHSWLLVAERIAFSTYKTIIGG